mgnify:CR=1 FL=1
MEDLEVFHPQLRIPDTPPDQGGVEDQGFHKAVVGPPQHFVVLRFLHAPGRIGPRVDHHRLIVALDQERERPRQNRRDHRRDIRGQGYFYITHEMPGKVLRAPPVPHLLRRQLHQIFQDFFHHLVLGETVHKVQRRLLAADQEFPSQKVEAGPKAYLFFEHGRIGFIPARQRPKFVAHRCPPFLRLPVQSDLVYPKTEGSRARREYFPKNIVIPGDFCYDRDKVNFEEAISMADEYTPNPNVPETPPEVPSEPAPPAMTPPPAPQPPVPPQYQQPAAPVPPAPQPPVPPQAPYTPPQNAGQYNYYQQQQPGYTPPYYPPAVGPQADPAKGKATGSLVLGLISLLCCQFLPLPIIGLILGLNAKKMGTPSSGMATAGVVLNIIALVISVISIVFMIFNWNWMIDTLEEIYGFCRAFL